MATHYPPDAPTTIAPGLRGQDLAAHLDRTGAALAIVGAGNGVDELRHPDFAATFASALNDWVRAEWLDGDPRLRASIVVPARDPEGAAREIDRVAGDRRFVQVALPVVSEALYGKRRWRPLFEAATRHGLPLALHAGGTSDAAPTPTGWPSWFLEEHVGHVQAFMSQLTSLVAEGTLGEFPALRIVLQDCGFTWLPSLLWRLDKEWKGLRRDIPWVTRPPSELVREHVRVTTAPMDAGAPDELAELVEQLGGERMLLYGSDYPRWHTEPIEILLDVLPEPARARVLAENARVLYGV